MSDRDASEPATPEQALLNAWSRPTHLRSASLWWLAKLTRPGFIGSRQLIVRQSEIGLTISPEQRGAASSRSAPRRRGLLGAIRLAVGLLRPIGNTFPTAWLLTLACGR